MSLTSEFQELREGRKIPMGRRRDENRKGGTVQKQLRYLPSKNDIGICFFLPPPYVRIEEMRCNILCCGWAAKTASQQLRHGFLYPRALLLLLDPRAQMNAPPFNLCADERISPGFHRQRQQKRRGPKKELASAAAALVAT
jgi:hypothetical protein